MPTPINNSANATTGVVDEPVRGSVPAATVTDEGVVVGDVLPSEPTAAVVDVVDPSPTTVLDVVVPCGVVVVVVGCVVVVVGCVVVVVGCVVVVVACVVVVVGSVVDVVVVGCVVVVVDVVVVGCVVDVVVDPPGNVVDVVVADVVGVVVELLVVVGSVVGVVLVDVVDEPPTASGRMIWKNACRVVSPGVPPDTRTWQLRQSGFPLFGDGSFGDRQLNVPEGPRPLNTFSATLGSEASNVATPCAFAFTGAPEV
jgi:hypothetical protein